MTDTTDGLRATVVRVLCDVAPDVDAGDVRDDDDLQTGLGLDSMDLLEFVAGLHEATGVDVPDADRAALANVGAIVAYVRARLSG